ncbi:alpha/beta fold hydrolase [Nocardioides sp. SR21]|uniref:alpha/beta fold hydrolase n=1 Tax=Nocardioides sp. SR21 TaxID=2919501 RepID=UPI001FA9CEA0|nr:alpha/beta fold hydrolase [Nocardioides sp. SR21]
MRIAANDIELEVRASGPEDGPPLVLLHALGEGATDWDRIAPAFAEHWRVVAVDLRGHGASDHPGSYSLELMRDDVLALLDALGLASIDLVGHSLGGFVAHLVAQHSPERVARLVLEDVTAPLPRSVAPPERPAGELGFDWDMVLAVRRQIDDPDPAWLDGLGRITADTLVVYGGALSPMPRERVEEIVRRIPSARMVTIEAGHLVHAAEPEQFTSVVLDFLR